jgi:hypothetical protein
MKAINWVLVGAAAFLSMVGGGPAIAQQATSDLPVDTTTTYKGEEFLLIGNAVRGAGEPVIAINPKNIATRPVRLSPSTRSVTTADGPGASSRIRSATRSR